MGTFAHRNIAFEFASWLSPEFKYYLISEFDRLKNAEVQQQALEWNLQRTLSKINYRIHTDAIKEQIIPKAVTKAQAAAVYASEADLLNVAPFGLTAAEWRSANPGKDGNMLNLLQYHFTLSKTEKTESEYSHRTLKSSMTVSGSLALKRYLNFVQSILKFV